jgi:drug/metabolite transporter (DMT)-like permease
MFASILTTFLFAISAVLSSRAARLIGPIQATVIRLIIAVFVLGVYAFSFGQGMGGPGLHVFLVSGLLGFGLGDIALFYAYEKLGARLAILLAQCLAVPFAAAAEWIWLGTVLTREIVWIILILLGICLAVMPSKKELVLRATSLRGLTFGIVAALGQAGGAVLSRKAIMLNEAAQVHIDGATASFQRIIAGMLISACVLLLMKHRSKVAAETSRPKAPASQRSGVWSLCVANAVSGPILGVSCYQWALSVAPSAVVLSIVATTPIVILPMAWVLENDRPSLLSLASSLLAVGGVIGLLIG